ncbi:MAG TPA: helix-turn-helix domain-containing protein [Saprospiraceae bacterium]|nr:helix-turn-helix domain-containing protein [Saprospiraceae bacterium]
MSSIQEERELLSKPGDVIAETIDYIKMTQVELAERMGKTPSKVNDIISGKEPITIATALQLEKVLGIDASFWLNRELIYRQKLTRIEQEEALEDCIDWLKLQPITELKKCGYITQTRIGTTMAEECLKFYGVATPVQWQSVYANQYISSSFRKSVAHETTLSAMTAWLRIGELEMRKLKLNEYSKDKFKDALSEIRILVRKQPEEFASILQDLCLKAGVSIVYTLCISKAPASGAARWIGGNPLIQLTDRYKSNDQFWFTFFHEAGHILLHGKKEVFIEDFEGYVMDEEKEKEADNFANKWLLGDDISKEFSGVITEVDIKAVARKYDTHPAIVLGRLQYLKMVPYSFGTSLRLKVFLDNMINKVSDNY